MYAEISRAYFFAKAVRPVYAQLLAEDFRGRGGEQLGRSHHEYAQDARRRYRVHRHPALLAEGDGQGRANSCLFWLPFTKVCILVHGDDFDKSLEIARRTR